MTRFDIEPDQGPEPWDQDYEMAAAERGVELPDGPGYDEHYEDHDCPRDQFLDDPITQAYGVGGEMLHLIRCPVCEARDAD
jgi:hypothetical protein